MANPDASTAHSTAVTLRILAVVLFSFLGYLCAGIPLAVLPGYVHHDLDFSSVPALLASLAQKPNRPNLVSAPEGDDVLVLRVFAKRPEILQRAQSTRALAQLWDVCRIPNYEKRIPEHQAERLSPLFLQLVEHGTLSRESIDRELGRLTRFEGDIHQLMDQLSSVRTWNYVSHQAGWVEGAEELRERTRELEDKLGDLLHQRLRERFLGKSRRHGAPRSGAPSSASVAQGPFAKLVELPMYEGKSSEPEPDAWIEGLIEARFEELRIDASGELRFGEQRVARLEPGPTHLRPELKLLLPDWVAPGSRARVTRRLVAHVRDSVSHLLAPLDRENAHSPALRGLLYQLEQGLGTIPASRAREQLKLLSAKEFTELGERAIRMGKFSVFCDAMLDRTRLDLRCALMTTAERSTNVAEVVRALDRELNDLSSSLSRDAWFAVGFIPLSSQLVRCDVIERLHARLAPLSLEERPKALRLELPCTMERAQTLAQELFRTRRRRKRPGPRRS